MQLPEPRLDGKMSLEEAIGHRRTRRSFKDKVLTFEQLSREMLERYYKALSEGD